jgi:hypothetical protein
MSGVAGDVDLGVSQPYLRPFPQDRQDVLL